MLCAAGLRTRWSIDAVIGSTPSPSPSAHLSNSVDIQ